VRRIKYNLGLAVKGFILCGYTGTLRSCGFNVTGIKFMYVISREGMRLACSLGCNDIAALSPWERYIVYPFRLIAINQILCMIRVEAAKLAQTGFGDFLADAV